MLRFLFFIISACILYFLINTVAGYNTALEFTVFDYQIETSLFVFIFIFIMLQFFITSFVKIVAFFVNLPAMFRDRWNYLKGVSSTKKLVMALSESLLGNKDNTLQIAKRMNDQLQEHDSDIVNLINAENEKNSDKKSEHLLKLIGKKSYNLYAAKQLAKIFFDKGNYSQSEEYALKAFNVNDSDPEVIMILIRIYANIQLWEKMVYVSSKLKRTNSKEIKTYSTEISKFFYKAAKDSLKQKDDKKAMGYLESALDFKPDSIESLNMFMELATSNKNSSSLLKVLKAAYVAKPSFELARMFADSSKSSADVVYGTLAGLVKPEKYMGLYFAIAGYLGLYDKIDDLKAVAKTSKKS